jgi:flavorubredoxin
VKKVRITKINEIAYSLSINVKDILFESLWEMPNGVSINSYIVKGNKIALIDGVCGWDGVPESLFELLGRLDIKIEDIKYVILNHLEPDHAGFINDLLKIHQDFEVISTKKGNELIKAFYSENIITRIVGDNDFLDLGNEVKLTFQSIPHVHWPDSMVTYLEKDGILFSCDAFGSFGIWEMPYDEDLSEAEEKDYEKETIRYYSNVIGGFSPFVLKAIEKLSKIDIKVVAPGHGIMFKKNPRKIIDDYYNYAIYQKGQARDEIILLWGSMYSNTKIAVDYIIEELKSSEINFHVHDVSITDWGTMLSSVWVSKGVILAMPTYEYKMFPKMAAILEEFGAKKVHGRKAFRFGSYGWSGGAQKHLDEIMDRTHMNWDFIEPYEFNGKPCKEDLDIIKNRTKELIKRVIEE